MKNRLLNYNRNGNVEKHRFGAGLCYIEQGYAVAIPRTVCENFELDWFYKEIPADTYPFTIACALASASSMWAQKLSSPSF